MFTTERQSEERSSPFSPAIDAHTHLFPQRLSDAIRCSLSAETDWEFSHPTTRPEIEDVLRAAGVTAYVALPYAHKTGIARELTPPFLKSRVLEEAFRLQGASTGTIFGEF